MTDQSLPPVEAPPPIPASSRKILAALDNAWRRFNAFDEASKLLKTRYKRVRWGIILISFITTCAAVADARYSQRDDTVEVLMRVALVILPLLSAAILTFAARFEAGNGWVGFRVAAETIKYSIYELRLKRYLDLVTMDDLDKLAKVIEKTDEQLEGMGVSVPIEINLIDDNEGKESKQFAKPNNYAIDHPEDDGYSPLALEEYLRMRVLPQAEWYNSRAVIDFKKTRRWRAIILCVGVIGPALAAFGAGYLVAVTVALTNGLLAYIGLQQYEQNYGIYSKTARQLENLVNQLEPKMDNLTSTDILDWVRKIETVFGSEREMWQLTVLRGQSATEEALTQLVNSRTNVLQNSDFGKLAGGQAGLAGQGGMATSERAPATRGTTYGPPSTPTGSTAPRVPTSYPGTSPSTSAGAIPPIESAADDALTYPPSYPIYPPG
ncbi:MAG: SLATT domain-containing protein [Chloroflexi bacterium]|nr:SLATT domain-containing protein [Chloroflexota bacterium]